MTLCNKHRIVLLYFNLVSCSISIKFNCSRDHLSCLVHFFTVTVAQNALMPSMSSALVFGFTSLCIYSFSSCHSFSMGLKSGDSAGVFHQLMHLNSRKSGT